MEDIFIMVIGYMLCLLAGYALGKKQMRDRMNDVAAKIENRLPTRYGYIAMYLKEKIYDETKWLL